MKKLTALTTLTGLFLTTATNALADVPVVVNQTYGVKSEAGDAGTIVGQIITIVFVIAVIVVLFFLILGAFQWITSGGDKEKINKARSTIINALIGMAILALSFFIIRLVGQIVHIDFSSLKLPSLGSSGT